jgi:tetratricopeptide (TPR) repeat protein
VADSSEDVRALLQHGMSLSESGDVAEALRVFDQAATISPVDRVVKYLRATCLIDLGREAEAESTLREAISDARAPAPTSRLSAQMWLLLGLILREKGMPQEAAGCVTKALQFDVPGNALVQALTLLANCQLHFDISAAAESAERALEIDPSWEEATKMRDEARRRLGDD